MMRVWSVVLTTLIFLAVSVRHAAATPALPDKMTLPAGTEGVDKTSKLYDYFHVEVGYPKNGKVVHEDYAGKTWVLTLKLTTPNKSGDDTAKAMRAWLTAAGWKILTPTQPIVAKRTVGTKEQWVNATTSSGDAGFTFVEVSPPPHVLDLKPPAKAIEKVGDGDDWPYLQAYPGAKLKRTFTDASRHFDVTESGPGKVEQIAGPPVVVKEYDLPASLSAYERLIIYRDALTKAGWTIIRAQSGGDSQVTAHYAKDGRDIFVQLHDGMVSVADVGAQNEAKKLLDLIAKDGHVAIYGIYFDIDKDVLKPESETALNHILDLLKLDPKLKLEVQGHTDSTGKADHNMTLSDARAASVKKWLLAHGVADARLVTKGYGQTVPVGDNNTPEGRSKNRRVELKKL